MSGWEKVGVINVDAGLCWVGDPCYIFDNAFPPFKSWQEFCKILHDGTQCQKQYQQFNHTVNFPGLGVTVETGYGDGEYEVFIKRNSEKRIAKVMVVFDDEKGDY